MVSRFLLFLLAVFVVTSVSEARPPYSKKMFAMYAEFGKKHGDTTKKSVSCSVCHVKEGVKSNYKKRNNYGFEVSKTLTKKNDTAKIEEAIKKAASGKSLTAGKTFGDLIKALERPGTNDEKKK